MPQAWARCPGRPRKRDSSSRRPRTGTPCGAARSVPCSRAPRRRISRAAISWQSRRPRRGSWSRAPKSVPHRGSREWRISASRYSRRARGGRSRQWPRSPCCAGLHCGSESRWRCRWSCPRRSPRVFRRGRTPGAGSHAGRSRACADRGPSGYRPRTVPTPAGSRQPRRRRRARGTRRTTLRSRGVRRCFPTWRL